MVFERGLMHQGADGEVGQQIAVKLLNHQFRGFAAQAFPGVFEVIFDFIVAHFDFPAFMINGGQFGGRSLKRIKNAGDQDVFFFAPFESIFNHSDGNAVGPLVTVISGRIELTQVGTVKKFRYPGKFHDAADTEQQIGTGFYRFAVNRIATNPPGRQSTAYRS